MKPCNFYNGENMFRIFFIQRMVDCGQNLLIFKDMMKNEFNGEVGMELYTGPALIHMAWRDLYVD